MDSMRPGSRGQQNRVAAAERRARGQHEAAVMHHADLDRRIRILELRLKREHRPAIRTRLLEEIDALVPLRDAAQNTVAAFGSVHAVALARAQAERLR